jgi:quinolinate synthase
VHDEFKALELELLKKEHPKAKVLVHPESPSDVIALADLANALETGAGEIHVDPALGLRARVPIDRMLAFTAGLKNGQTPGRLVAGIGAA